MSPDGPQDDELYGGSGQTRTRLPESSGARRPGRSPSRSLVTVVGVVVLLIAAIAFANRGTDDTSGGSEPSGTKPAAAPTAPTGAKPVSSGFEHDEQGAQSAAANYAVRLGGDGMFNADRRHGIVDELYTSAAATKLKGPMDEAYSTEFLTKLGLDADGKAPKGSTFVSRTIPVGTKTLRYEDDAAKVSVWYMGLLGISGTHSTNPVATSWQTWTFQLQWIDGDWKITSDSQKNGPTPVPGDDRASNSDDISKAIEEYGGFSYAR
ncbi:hypothetical protein OG785_17105 [Streptomyces sp. NBC_00006]|uniref:hypothetical protein n=1 Tax=unclassified Streptomyces TaxID=2593676 RepID=UPI00225AF0D7|nr:MULTISPECIES: hypothetical protein [unclassified Streptomyces]MCX4828363.1 hypothetical protein [Streptomyces sp. NBC_01016]MCX5532285.1 hypothetical protein [Streptomyces sp. NBC_00006]